MLTAKERTVVAKRTYCAICSSPQLEALLDLPALPLTGVFSQKPMTQKPQGLDQKFLFCSKCGHGQLAYVIDPKHLYDNTYAFRTSQSATARAGTEFFLDFLGSVAPQQNFRCALDVGCNDLHLLRQLEGKAKIRVGVDPIWAAKPPEDAGDINVIGETLENSDILGKVSQKPDLIVCRHTLEHIYDPRQMLEKLKGIAADDALFIFEVPGLDTLVERSRFDQVFHQHLQYFSLSSFCKMLSDAGLNFGGYRVNYHDWGAMAVAFSRKIKSPANVDISFRHNARDIKGRFQVFAKHLESMGAVLDSFKDTAVYGYGASAMLPVLSYHMKRDLSVLRAVLDDDVNRDGFYYWNLPLQVQLPNRVKDLEQANVFLTAPDSAKPIVTRLLTRRPKNIIYPMETI